MSNTYPDGAPQTPYGDPNNAAGAEGAPEPQPTQAFPPVPVVPLPGQGAGAPTGAPAAPYGQGGAPYGGAPTAAYGESLAGPQGGVEPYGYQAAPYGREPGAYGQSGAGSAYNQGGAPYGQQPEPGPNPFSQPDGGTPYGGEAPTAAYGEPLAGPQGGNGNAPPRPMVSSPSRSMVPARLPLHIVSRLLAVLREGTVSRPRRTAASSRPPRTDSHTAPTSTVARNTGTSRPQSRRKATAIRTSRNRRRRRAAARSSPASPQVSLPSSPSSS